MARRLTPKLVRYREFGDAGIALISSHQHLSAAHTPLLLFCTSQTEHYYPNAACNIYKCMPIPKRYMT